jgi:hypothetical protein
MSQEVVMPVLAFAVALTILSAPLHSNPAVAQPTGAPMLAFDDEVYGDRDDDALEEGPDERSFNFYDEEDDDEDSSAHGPDDDDGWDVEEFERSERA